MNHIQIFAVAGAAAFVGLVGPALVERTAINCAAGYIQTREQPGMLCEGARALFVAINGEAEAKRRVARAILPGELAKIGAETGVTIKVDADQMARNIERMRKADEARKAARTPKPLGKSNLDHLGTF